MKILLVSWTVYRDRPKGRRGIPFWNLLLVLHQLARLYWNPLALTFKAVFLLTLGSDKHKSEIHAWQKKHVRHQSDWSKVSLFPSTQPFFPSTSRPRRVWTVWPQWLYQPWPQLGISPSSLIGPMSVQSTVLLIGTRSQTEQ